MKTTYEFSPSLVYASAGKGELIHLFADEGQSTTVKLEFDRVQATRVRRSLGRLLDEGGNDPAGGFSIKRLTELYKTFRDGGIVDEDELEKVITAYIRLIEYTNAKGEQ